MNEDMYCAICGRDLSEDKNVLMVMTQYTGTVPACISHEKSEELEDFIEENGGYMGAKKVLKEREKV